MLKIKKIIKLELAAGEAKPRAELASLGINVVNFCSQFNNLTKDRIGDIIPTVITANNDKTFYFQLKTSPTVFLLKKIAGIEKGSSNIKKISVATISIQEIHKIAEYKLPDLNTDNIDNAISIVAGTAKNMGIVVEGYNEFCKNKRSKKFSNN